MAVVVHDALAADVFGFDARADGAKGAQADGDFEEAVLVGADGRERWDGVVEGERWGWGRSGSFSGAQPLRSWRRQGQRRSGGSRVGS